MKFKKLNAKQLNKFFEVVQECKGKVYLISPDMNINLKSNLSKYISFVNLCAANKDEISKIEILANEREDIDMLYQYLKEKERE